VEETHDLLQIYIYFKKFKDIFVFSYISGVFWYFYTSHHNRHFARFPFNLTKSPNGRELGERG
jgi:hypothetical protein